MTAMADPLQRNNVTVTGRGEHTLVLAHGFGCDQNMWRFVTPDLERHYRLVLFDYVGFGGSDLNAFDRQRYAELEGYAADLVEILETLNHQPVTLVGHSVSSMISLIAARQAPDYVRDLVMVCPSPCFLNKPPEYYGGFERADLQEMMDLLEKNYIGWANYLAPLVLGGADDKELVNELADSFCSTDPIIARTFAQATFFSDYRHLLPGAEHSSLLLQSEEDALADVAVGEYMQKQMPEAALRVIPGQGHCLHMSHPAQVTSAMLEWFSEPS